MLLDERYGQSRIRSKLPSWMQPALHPADSGCSSDFAASFAQLVTVSGGAGPRLAEPLVTADLIAGYGCSLFAGIDRG